MMMRFSVKGRIPATFVFAVILLVPTHASTGGASATLAYSDAGTYRECEDWFGTATCSSAADADRTTGSLTLELAVTSPLNGVLPGLGRAEGFAWVVATHTLTRAVKEVPFTVTFHIGSAQASRTGGGDGYAFGLAFADHATCERCSGGMGWSIVDVHGRSSRSNEEIVRQGAIVNRDGGLVPPGEIALTVQVWGRALLGPASGTVRVSFDGTVTRVEVG